MISPFLISPDGLTFLTAQMITSPTLAILRLNLPLLEEPRSTLMHIACLAPLLSAMSTYDCCWIMLGHSFGHSRFPKPVIQPGVNHAGLNCRLAKMRSSRF